MANLTGEWKRWIYGPDPHGIEQNREANKAFFEFNKIWQPQIRVAGGDIWNFAQLRKKADPYEKRDSMAQDVAEGQEWMEKLKPTVFLRGNHDERLWDFAEQTEGIVADYAKLGVKRLEDVVKKLNCQMYPYNKRTGVYQMGALCFIHGYITGITAARRTAMIYGNVVMGHGHQIQSATVESVHPRVGFMAGCLCNLELGYNRQQAGTLNWEPGWGYGITNTRTGSYQYWQARKIDGKWIIPSDVCVL